MFVSPPAVVAHDSGGPVPPFEIRPFRRADRDQLTHLVNRHAAAVVPGASASVSTVLGQLEREPDEFIVDPWVGARRTLVAEQAGAVVAAAHLLRYRADPDVGDAFRDAGEIHWLLFTPMAPTGNPHWSDGHAAAEALMDACLRQFDAWGVRTEHADGQLPVAGVYGVPEQWPHVERLYARHGFAPRGETESVWLVDLADLPVPDDPPLPGLQVRRLVGVNGTRLTAHLDGSPVAHIEVDLLDRAERHPQQGGLADIGNLEVLEGHRRCGVGSWLLRHAAQWLRLGRAGRLMAYTRPSEAEQVAFFQRHGFTEVTRTRRGWRRSPEGS
jgi:GNAT superfamily N-acetyltransferase